MGQPQRAVSSFVIDRWETDEVLDAHGVKFVRTGIDKTFAGDLAGSSTGEMTMAHASGGSAAYVGFEQIRGALHGRQGTFVLHHSAWGTPRGREGRWTVMEGSGTGELEGLRGTAQIERHDDGSHTFTLDYTLEPAR